MPQALPSDIKSAVAITLSNNQGISTGSPFQQLVVVDSGYYLKYESQNLANIRFFYQNGTVVPSWLESNNTADSNMTFYWLKLENGIPAGSEMTVYMGFADTSANLFNNYSTGEAPQLSCNDPSDTVNGCAAGQYGRYDNGHVIFQFYDNFAGDTLSPIWTVPAGAMYSVDNGFNAEPSRGSTTGVYDANVPEANSTVDEWYIAPFNESAGTDTYFQLNRYTASSNLHLLGAASWGAATACGTGKHLSHGAYSDVLEPERVGLWNNGSKVGWYSNYDLYVGKGWRPQKGLLYPKLGVQRTAKHFPTIYWVRSRTYPPNGIMPDAS